MLEMDPVHAIRWKFYKEGVSQREIARQMGCSRNTVRKYLNQPEPEYRRTKEHAAPVRAKAERLIEKIAAEWGDGTGPPPKT